MDRERPGPLFSGAKRLPRGGRPFHVRRVATYTLRMLRQGRLGFAALALIGACSGATADISEPLVVATSTTSSPSVVATPTLAAVPTPTAEEVPPVPLPDNYGDDFRHILSEIASFESYLAQNPDPAQLELIYALECPCFEQEYSLLEELADCGHRFSGDTSAEILQVSFVSNADGLAQVLVKGNAPGGSVVDIEGVVQRTVPATGFDDSVFLALGQDGRWRILAVDPVTIDPPEFESLESRSAGE